MTPKKKGRVIITLNIVAKTAAAFSVIMMLIALDMSVFVALSTTCKAAEIGWTAPVASKHYGTAGMVPLNGSNPGFGLELRRGELSYGAGVYRNSLFRNSIYVEASYVPLHIGPARIGLTLGAATGYDSKPVMTGFAIARFNRFDILFAPKSPGRSPGLIGLRITGRFK